MTASQGRLRLVTASIAINSIASLSVVLQPAVIAEFVSQRGLTSSSAGLIATAEMAVLALAMMLWTRYGGSVRYLTLTWLGMVILLAATIGSMVVDSMPALLTMRMFAAIGFALLSLVASMAIANLPNAGTLYGLMFAIGLACSALPLALLPTVEEWFGRPPAFPASLLCIGVLLPLVLLLPASTRFSPNAAGGGHERVVARRSILFIAAAMSVVAISYYEVWAFFIVLAGRAGLSPAQASATTAVSLCGAVAGSLLSGPMARWIGSARFIALSTVTLSVCLLVMIAGWSPNAFRIAGFFALASFFAWFPAVLGSAAEIDPTGKGVAIVSACSLFFGAAGPYLGGLLIQFAGPAALATVNVVAMIATLYLFHCAGIANNKLTARVE